MDFDLSKENIQPLRGGRNVSQLEVALQAQNSSEYHQELMHQREVYENTIKNYAGNDPLENWYNYIFWIEQSYPKHGHEGNLVPLLEQCLQMFENDERYRNDRRLCKLLIKYVDLQPNPLELYHMTYARGLCRGCADLYKAWAYYHEAAGDFQSANRVFEVGKRDLAQPYDELERAHNILVVSAGQHMLYGPNDQQLCERREALTSLHTYKSGRHVGSVRVPTGAGGPGTLAASVGGGFSGNAPHVQVYQDHGRETVGLTVAAAPVASLFTGAHRQDGPKENALRPGPWTTVPVKKRHAPVHNTPSFTVHEDEPEMTDQPQQQQQQQQYSISPSQIPSHTLENFSNWLVSVTLPEPDDGKLRMYPKAKVYSEPASEYSLEEIRAYLYMNTLSANKNTSYDPVQDMSWKHTSIVNSNSTHNESSNSNTSKAQISLVNCQPHENNTKSPVGVSNNIHNSYERPQPFGNNKRSESIAGNNCPFEVWDSPDITTPVSKNMPFEIFEESTMNHSNQAVVGAKGSAMKTPFQDLADELAETGSRSGMDAPAAAPVDSAKRLPLVFADDEDDDASRSISPFDRGGGLGDVTCNTQVFNFNLNAMQVSTPQPVSGGGIRSASAEDVNAARKQLFLGGGGIAADSAEKNPEKALSVIFEETKSYASSSSSSGATTKSCLSTMQKPSTATISEEHSSYLAQNLMANAALRASLLGEMDFSAAHSPSHTTRVPPIVDDNEITVIEDSDDEDEDDDEEPVKIVTNQDRSPSKPRPLDFVPSDPFKLHVIDQMLIRVSFPGPHTYGYINLVNVPKPTGRNKEVVTLGSDTYTVEKQLGKGTFGVVYRGVDRLTKETVALKYQKPPNRWEYYICKELQRRLSDHVMRDRFMDVRIGYFAENASMLISQYSPCGSLLHVANLVKEKTSRLMRESVCVHFCLEMVKIVRVMHEANIIHGDIKPDNFLVVPVQNDLQLQLIDFGCSIDMTMFPRGAAFTRKITTENFVCCEMLDGRPWSYHTDLFCVAATAHVLLIGSYIDMEKRGDRWCITKKLPRYSQALLWENFFSMLLNQQEGPANYDALIGYLEEAADSKFQEIQREVRLIKNMIMDR